MKVVIQRVSEASVVVEGQTTGSIEAGFLILFGAEAGDGAEDLDWLVNKIINLRIFNDENGKMNLSLLDVDGSALVVSQFTLFGDCRKGRRPSFVKAAAPELANRLYEGFCAKLESSGIVCEKGIFAADMKVSLLNDGPVTLIIDSNER